MEISKKAKAAAARIAKRAGVSEVAKAYRAAANGAPVNLKSLYLG